MAKMLQAVQRILPEGESRTNRITPRMVILHSAVGSGSLYNYFKDRSVLESHFWVDEDGTIEQYVDTNVRADANYKANAFAISVETADQGNPDVQPWTAAQMDSLADICVWAHLVHGVPLRKVAVWDGAGIGFHTQFGAPGPWTPVAKSCPGKIRIKQFPDVIDLAILKNKPKPSPVEDTDMQLTDEVNLGASDLKFLKDRGLAPEITKEDPSPDVTLDWFIRWGYIEQVKTTEAIQRMQESHAQVNAAVLQELKQLNSNFGALVLALDELTSVLDEDEPEVPGTPV